MLHFLLLLFSGFYLLFIHTVTFVILLYILPTKSHPSTFLYCVSSGEKYLEGDLYPKNKIKCTAFPFTQLPLQFFPIDFHSTFIHFILLPERVIYAVVLCVPCRFFLYSSRINITQSTIHSLTHVRIFFFYFFVLSTYPSFYIQFNSENKSI